MDFTNVLQTRRSVKSFKNQEVPEDKLNNILNSVRFAPSWENHQCWRIVVIKDENTRMKLAECVSDTNTAHEGLRQAPIQIVICAEPHRSAEEDGKAYYLVDSAIAMDHLILSASNEGLGSCWVGDFDEEKVRTLLKIPREYKIVALTPIGYPEKTPDTEYKRAVRDIAFSDQWGRILH